MLHIRPLRADDIDEIVAVRRLSFRHSARPGNGDLGRYFADVFLGHPWQDDAFPSLVYVNGQGRPVGFLGVIPRPATFQGERVRIAVATQFMVHPDHRGVAGVQLLKRFLSGDQDLSLADLANDVSHRLWEQLGGATALIPSLHWTLEFPHHPIAGGRAARRVLSLVWPRWRAPAGVRRRDLTPELLGTHLPEILRGTSLLPEYDSRSAAWTFHQLASKRGLGEMRSASLWTDSGEVLGWYVYYADGEGMGRVVHLVARSGARDRVLQDLFARAWSEGLAAVTGRLETALVGHAGRAGLVCKREGPWMLVQSSRPEILEAVERGDAFLSSLEGEGLLSF
ncbi:MAG TPA: GNAT family N-acetyltransferase [Gemmatimonadales bacterium]|nr:GNAT family N-acetyltransferase [Gemmatimonadales bacterium]